jgi:2-phospho-L-lactate guanylyltransferase (CobY/MobA/RfbA family)
VAELKKEIKPVRQRNRHASFHLRDGIEKAIQLMLENDIIEKSEGPTPWVSQIVPIMKESGEIRICLDSKMINTAIERQCHSCPTAEEVAIDLNEAKVISKFDLKNAFNQYELAPECRYITVFYTHMGLYRFKRLCFGINCAPKVFRSS